MVQSEENTPDRPPMTGPVEPEKSSRFKVIFNLILVLVLIAAGSWRPIFTAAGRYLVLESPVEKADVIVVLAGSPVVRTLAAADYFRQGLAPRVFLSRGWLEKASLLKELDIDRTGNWELSRKILTQSGVPEEAIDLDPSFVPSTIGEAKLVKKYMAEKGFKKLILVTSRFHSRRAFIIFSHFLAEEEIKIVSLPSRYDPFDPEKWWTKRQMAKTVVLEYQKLLYLKLELR